jgi:hypothetical protein
MANKELSVSELYDFVKEAYITAGREEKFRREFPSKRAYLKRCRGAKP